MRNAGLDETQARMKITGRNINDLSYADDTTLMAESKEDLDGETMERVRDFIFGAPKSLQMVTVAMKLRHLLLGRKAMINLDSILKSRDITLSTKIHLVKAMVFPVVMNGCELACEES